MVKRLQLQIPAPHSGWTFFHVNLLTKLCCLFEKTEKWKKSSGMILLANICCISEISKNWKTPAN